MATQSAGWYGDSAQAAVAVNNSAGWSSLAAGAIGLGIVVVTSMLGQKVYVLYFPLIAFNTSTVARWTILSSSVGMPSGRCRPSALGMYARLTGFARYAPRFSRPDKSARCSSRA